MPYILIIDKMGAIKEMNIKEYKESDLFKKAGFKSAEGFLLQSVWDQKNGSISVYAKKNGKAGQENKYEFPPPIDSVLFFGGCVLIKKTRENEISDLRISEWNVWYERLMGGFEELGEEDSEEEEVEEDEEDEKKVLMENGVKIGKNGYILDDFIVDDEEFVEELNDDFSEKEFDSETEKVDKKKTKSVKKKTASTTSSSSKKSAKITVLNIIEPEENIPYLDCESELVEEAYV